VEVDHRTEIVDPFVGMRRQVESDSQGTDEIASFLAPTSALTQACGAVARKHAR
jgi:hypothetical protein